jgi:DNA-binding CsgD family transcriptional regulator
MRVAPRQRQVLAMLVGGHTDAEIASALGISISTVRTYLGRLYRDNGFANRTEAVVAWLQFTAAGGTSRRGDGKEKYR